MPPQSVAPAQVPAARPDGQSIESILAEIRQTHALDAQAEEELVRNLRATPPSLWPLVVHQFRAALAYRRQSLQRQQSSPTAAPQAPDAQSLACHVAPSPPSASPPSPAHQPAVPPPAGARPTAAAPPLPSPHAPAGPQFSALAKNPPPSADASTPGTPTADAPTDRGVVAASYQSAPGDDWRSLLDETIRRLESRVAASPQSAEELADHARLRLLYLADGRRDQALRPIPSLSPSMEDFWSKELCGLAVLLDPQRHPDSMRRAGEAQQHLAAAAQRLGESAPLIVRNLAFVTDVQSYGSFTPFEKYEFRPGQRVLLYAEIENFKTNATPRGYHTALKSSYQILDSRGQRVTEHDFGTNEEYCHNPRRDFFIGYEFVLPKHIYPGKHTLQLTVTDLNGDKIGQSPIDFTIVVPEP